MGIFRGGGFPCGNCPGGIIRAGVFLVPFFENKTKKIKKVSVCKRSLFDFISYMFISLALSKQLRQKQIKQDDWLTGTNSFLIGWRGNN